jgi:peptidoglycan/LPS O-acetylase OafA/YrhL
MLKSESDEFLNLDALRGLSAVCIVLFHIPLFTKEMGLGWSYLKGFPAFVDLFFAISGIIIARFYLDKVSHFGDYGNFAARRLFRLAPLHILTALLMLGILWSAITWFPSIQVFPSAVRCVAPNFLMINAFGVCDKLSLNWPSWSISAELGMYLLVLPLVAAGARMNRLVVLVAFLGSFILLTLVQSPNRSWAAWTYDFGVLRAVPSFLFGCVLWIYRDILAKVRAPSPWVVAGVWATTAVALAFWKSSPAALLLMYAIVTLAFLNDLSRRVGSLTRSLAPFGQLTYSLYMWHTPVLMGLVSVVGFGMLGLTGLWAGVWVVLVLLTVLPALTAFSFFILERPSRKALNRLLR